jgi:hypothetical protein
LKRKRSIVLPRRATDELELPVLLSLVVTLNTSSVSLRLTPSPQRGRQDFVILPVAKFEQWRYNEEKAPSLKRRRGDFVYRQNLN